MSVGLAVKAPRRSLRRDLGQAVTAGLRFWRGPRVRGVLSAARAGPGLAATLLQRLAHPGQLQVAVVLLRDIELLGRAVGVPDRQLIGLTRGDLGLVEIRHIHRDRLGPHRNSFLGRSAAGSRAAPFRSCEPQRTANDSTTGISFGLSCHQWHRRGPPPTSRRCLRPTNTAARHPTEPDRRWAVARAARPGIATEPSARELR